MLTLGVDTATSWCSLGVWHPEGPRGEIACRRLPRQDDPLLPALDRLLEVARVDKAELELLAVALGPGSFTGLRVGLSLVKGLALGLGLPVVGVPSLPLYAARVAAWPGTVGALVGDRPERAYLAWFVGGRAQGEPAVISREALQARLKRVEDPVLLVGPGAEGMIAGLSPRDGVVLAAAAANRPSGLDVARAGQWKHSKQGADELGALEPLYAAEPAVHPGSRARTR